MKKYRFVKDENEKKFVPGRTYVSITMEYYLVLDVVEENKGIITLYVNEDCRKKHFRKVSDVHCDFTPRFSSIDYDVERNLKLYDGDTSILWRVEFIAGGDELWNCKMYYVEDENGEGLIDIWKKIK